LLNSDRTPREWRNGVASNVLLVAAALLFAVLCLKELTSLGS
jgi:hypothetical protein